MATKQYGYIFRDPSEKSREIVRRDSLTLSPSYTRSYGFAISHGKGAEVWDADDNRYVDFAAGIAVLSTGYSHPRIVEVIKQQAERYIHIGGTDFFCPEPVKLAEKLQEIIPINRADATHDKLIYFANSGTEAIESALKLARYYDNRPYIIAFYGGFHGRTMGSLSVTASKAVQRANYPYIPGGVEHVLYPSKYACEHDEYEWMGLCDAARYIEEIVFKKKMPANEVAAILVEPIQGEGGYIMPTDDFLPKLRQLCDRHGILLIVDEIQSGVGRTGTWCAVEHWGVQPDIVCLAKGLGSGMPIGAMVAHKEVMGKWVSGAHASTFGGNPLACAVASETIEIIKDEGLLASITKLGEYTLKRLSAFKANHPCVKRVEGKGLMIGVEFADAQGKQIPSFRDKVVEAAYLNGLLTLGCGASAVRIAPPLVITRELIEEGLDILEMSIAAVEEEEWEAIVQHN
jgi:4-aminobutyrate aminotransferase